MRRRLTFLLLAIVIVAACAVYAIPRSYFVIVGLCRGERFFAGWPTSYWIDQIKKHSAGVPSTGDVGKTLADGGADAIPVLFEILREGDPEVGQQALLALLVLEPLPASAAPMLFQFLHTGLQPSHRAWAAQALTRIQLPRTEVVPALRQALGDEDRQVRYAALSSLWTLHVHEPDMLPVVTELLKHKLAYKISVGADVELPRPPEVQVHALLAQYSSEAIYDVMEELKAPDASTRAAAIAVLNELSGAPKASILSKALDDHSPIVRTAAVDAIRRNARAGSAGHSPIDAPEVPKFLRLLQSEDRSIRIAAALALAGIDPYASSRQAVPVILERLKDKGQPFGIELANALATFGESSDEAFRALTKLLADGEPDVRRLLVWRIRTLGPRAIPLLLARLADKDYQVQRNAVYALEAMGPTAKDAIPALSKLSKDGGRIAQIADEALEKIDPHRPKTATKNDRSPSQSDGK